MKYIVTGATGFLGMALCRRIIEQGNELVMVVRPDSAKKPLLKEFEEKAQIIELGLDELERLYTDYDIRADVFYHLAWNGAAGAAREDFDIQYSNIKYTSNAICAAKKCGCRRIIGAGSQAEYGVVMQKAYEDKTLPHPFMMYGAAKLAAYEMGHILAERLGIELVWPRIYSVYGVGENPGTLINYILDCIRKGENAKLSLCENTWNFIYISDCVEMLYILGCAEEKLSGIYHIASKDTRMLKDFVKEIYDMADTDTCPEFGANPANLQRTFQLNPDISKMQALNAECCVSFEEGIRRKLTEVL